MANNNNKLDRDTKNLNRLTTETGKEKIKALIVDPAYAKKHGVYGSKAVLFGIDKYMIPGADLAGCKNDVYDVAETLLQLGFPKSHIHIITDERATTHRWYKEMEWLTDNTGPGDVRIYMHSGHGTNKADLDGDEPDQRDEMPVFHNFSWSDSSTHITDDDIAENFTKKLHKECKGELILDTCHSGTGARSLAFSRGGLYTRVKYLPNPDQQFFLNRVLPIEEKHKWFGNSNVDREIAGDATYNNGTIYACQDFDLAYETAILVNGEWKVRGLMTYHLCNILRERRGDITRRELGQELRARVAVDSPQVPGYEASNEQFYNQYPFRRAHQDEPGEVV